MRFNVGRFTSFSTEIESFSKIFLYSMKIKVQTRKLAAGCSKHGFEVVDETDEVSNHTYGKATLTWFEEIFEKY
ncbi:N-ethylammeline chlorohydrolase [Streptococcus pneumoniae]|nr:N-ethylammeline chlorohydrolase [Streptococcus pneumoniae]CJA36379.1 N-ethylammeline chlorohydrolase [Streptococcus pneumoniae]